MTKCEDCRFSMETKYRTECRVNPPSFYGLAIRDGQCDPRGGVWPTVSHGDKCGRGEPKATLPPNCDGQVVFDEASGKTCWLDKDGAMWPIDVYTRKTKRTDDDDYNPSGSY